MKEIYVGVDNGYGNTKNDKEVIQSGVKKLPNKPPILPLLPEFPSP